MFRRRLLCFARFWIPLVVLAAAPAAADAQQPVYVRQDDGTIVKQFAEDVSSIKKDVADLKRDVAEIKSLLAGTKVAAPSSPVVAVRAPQGHTHTCPNGHTWDHSMDGGTHRCPVAGCGLMQFVQDPPGRNVPAASPPVVVYRWSSSSVGSGCTGAGCEVAGYAPRRGGLFGGGFRR